MARGTHKGLSPNAGFIGVDIHAMETPFAFFQPIICAGPSGAIVFADMTIGAPWVGKDFINLTPGGKTVGRSHGLFLSKSDAGEEKTDRKKYNLFHVCLLTQNR
jgi:hypothetical protein